MFGLIVTPNKTTKKKFLTRIHLNCMPNYIYIFSIIKVLFKNDLSTNHNF